MVAALFTSKLGVARTLIGTALTAMTINLGSAVLSAQLERASTKFSTLATNVRDRLSTQKVRIPEPVPEPSTRSTNGGGQRGRPLSRLRSIPDYSKNLTSARRRSILLAGVLAGLVATIIGLGDVTGIELASGKNLSCQFWSECSTTAGLRLVRLVARTSPPSVARQVPTRRSCLRINSPSRQTSSRRLDSNSVPWSPP